MGFAGMVQARFRNILKITLFIVGFFLFLPNAMARLIDPEALILQIIKHNQKVGQFTIHSRVQIFDPEALSPLNEKLATTTLPQSLPNRSYKQKIVFVRDEFVGIETSSTSSSLLHLTLKKGMLALYKNYSRSRYFSPEDVFFEPILFFTTSEEKFSSRLGNYGLSPNHVKMAFYNGKLLYQLGNDEEYLLVHPTYFRVEKIQQLVQINARSYPIEIKFSKFDPKLKRVPQLVQYSINGRLFKELKVTDIRFRRISRDRNKLLKRHKKVFKKATLVERIKLTLPEWKNPEAALNTDKKKSPIILKN